MTKNPFILSRGGVIGIVQYRGRTHLNLMFFFFFWKGANSVRTALTLGKELRGHLPNEEASALFIGYAYWTVVRNNVCQMPDKDG